MIMGFHALLVQRVAVHPRGERNAYVDRQDVEVLLVDDFAAVACRQDATGR